MHYIQQIMLSANFFSFIDYNDYKSQNYNAEITFYLNNFPTISMMITYYILSFFIFYISRCEEYTDPATTPQGSTTFTVTFDGNAFYIAGSNDKRIYRYEMTQRITSPTNNIQTTHSLNINSLGVSRYQYYIASGAADYRVEVRLIKTDALVCTLWHHNQIRGIVFDPTHDQTLYTAALDDKIRKWNISNCSIQAEITPPQSVNTLAINSAGTQLAYGTLYGDVGYIDSGLTTLTNTANGHMYCVLNVMYTYPDYYVTIGHEAHIVLWRNGVQIDRLTSIAPNRLIECSLMVKARYNDTFRTITCTGQNSRVYLYRVSNSSITRFTDHGFSQTPDQWLIGHHMEETSLQWIIGQSNSLYYNYIFDDNTQCSPHTGWHSVLKICRLCWYMIQGCHFCDDENTCTTCMGGTYRSGGSCILCPVECISCSSVNNCQSCAPGYQQIGNSGKCRAMTGNQFGCFDLGTSGSRCYQQTKGYYINNNNVQLCNTAEAGCLECSGTSCLGCQTGYYLASFNCIRCNATIAGCIACANSTDCIECQVAFKYSGTNLHCSDCHPYCLTCGNFYDTCITCSSGVHHRQLIGTMCECQAGYYQNASQAVCGLCSSVLTNCYLCNNSTVCLQCHKDYFLYTSGGITQCQPCNQYCEDCNGTSNNCIACNFLNYHRVLSGSSCVCSTGYVSLGGSVPCYDCNVLDAGCLACSNDTYCTSCDNGYFLKIVDASNQGCQNCPYYCPDCSQNGSSGFICNSCPAGSHRTVINGLCTCNTGYFDDNNTITCQKCSDIIPNCDLCINRTKCQSCAPGLYPDESSRICSACRSVCLTCGTYFTQCTSCNPSQNRILINGYCACQQYAYQDNNICILCSTAIQNCNSCQNPYLCTGCQQGYTLQQDLKACIDCAGQINGCDQCTSTVNCTDCQDQFVLINAKCRCPNSKYTSQDNWGTCVDYIIPGLSSSLGLQVQVHQHQNNSLFVFIRFRAQTLYALNQDANSSIRLHIDGQQKILSTVAVDNNRIIIRTEINKQADNANITVSFDSDVFYNEKLLTLDNHTFEVTRRKLYLYDESQVEVYMSMKETLVVVFYIFKWIFFGLTIIGVGHLIYPFVVIIQLLPLFLMLNMSLPSNLSALMEAMLSFQVPSIVPLLEIKSDFSVFFPHMTYDYYLLRDYIVFGKLGDLILILLVNVLTKFDQGIVRMFPPGRIRRYLYEALVRKGYAVMSLCILSVQPSLFLLSSVYIPNTQWQVFGQVINYCCCIYIFGFYLAYNFNHASNLSNTKLLKNIDNDHCYYDLNSQETASNRAVFTVLIGDLWLTGALFLVGVIPYFIGAFILLIARLASQASPSLFIGKAQFVLRLLENILLLLIFVIMFVFYLGQEYILLGFEECDSLGLATQICIFLYILLCIIEKIIFNLKLETGWMKSKKIANENDDVIFAQKIEEADQQNQIHSDISQHNNRAFMNDTQFNKSNNMIKTNGAKNRMVASAHLDNPSIAEQAEQGEDNRPSNNFLAPNYSSNLAPQNQSSRGFPKGGRTFSNNLHTQRDFRQQQVPVDARKTDNYFSKSKKQQQEQKINVRTKSANTSKYAKNHLQLRYKAHEMTVLNSIDQDLDQ